MKKNTMGIQDKVLITGSNGLVGKAIINLLHKLGYQNIISVDRVKCDLTDLCAVKKLFFEEKPDYVFHLAAAVYGIGGNLKNRGSVFLDNILINTHVVEASHLVEVKKIVAMGTIAAYPEAQAQLITEDLVWQGPPHASESSYGHAKRAMLAHLLAYQESYGMDFSYVLSTNLYGPHDKFNVQYGHVIPSLIKKFYEAKKNNTEVTIWGDGSAARDFMYSQDMAIALLEIMQKISGPINVGTGVETKIKDVVGVLSNLLGMERQVKWDANMPNGRRYHGLDLSRLNSIGFKPSYSIEAGLLETYDWFAAHCEGGLIRE